MSDNDHQTITRVTCTAPVNIAVIKYCEYTYEQKFTFIIIILIIIAAAFKLC